MKLKVNNPMTLAERLKRQEEEKAKTLVETPSNSLQKIKETVHIVFDNSGSMQGEKIRNAKEAVRNFLTDSRPEDLIGLSVFKGDSYKIFPATMEKFILYSIISDLKADSATPLLTTLSGIFTDNIQTERVIVLTDGVPTDLIYGDDYQKEKIIQKYKENKIPIDTIFLGDSPDGESLMREFSEGTGGIFMAFTNMNDFSIAFSFLLPTKRQLLLNPAFRKDLGSHGE